MNTQDAFKTTTGLIANLGTTAHVAIDAWRDGGERLGTVAGQRWKAALKQSSPQLSAETRKNAAHAQQVFAGYYNRGLQMSTSGATVVVDTLVGAAVAAVERAAAWQQTRLAR